MFAFTKINIADKAKKNVFNAVKIMVRTLYASPTDHPPRDETRITTIPTANIALLPGGTKYRTTESKICAISATTLKLRKIEIIARSKLTATIASTNFLPMS